MLNSVSRAEWQRRTEEAQNRRPRKRRKLKVYGYDSYDDSPITILDYIGLWWMAIGSILCCVAVAYMYIHG